ncbi:superoxide dismutase [Fervidobacterium thailandense]|uniref:Superoxide dismutase n=1 Tax=Fervidobacterium thailandense TaxID=1008305 RepID=A0A1E3G1D8_9BACT|nr:superoxide dismutase [Fervidobacterium thailandense]ODN30056.1 superoxide dismutase [Fervidobacterium thailandense]
MFKLPEMGYGYETLEPYIDARTMDVHYNGHHAAYVKNLNAAIEKYPEFAEKPLVWLLQNLDKLPEDIRTTVRNNGGGHYNHTFWWPQLKKNDGALPDGLLKEYIERDFHDFENFKQVFKQVALSRFGSGWAWAIYEQGKIIVYSTPNQDNPIMEGHLPFLGLDVWEHAYYLKYQNRRDLYIDNFWNVVNWDVVESRFLRVLEGKQPLEI